jgi:transposase-like protein
MARADLQNPIFQDETKAREWLEARIWPSGPVCPHCGSVNKATKLEGKAHRPGVYQCNEPQCREQFTATVGTVFERSKIPLNKWVMALYLLTASKKGMSSHQMHRMLGVSYKSTWFMTHRLREAMKEGNPGPMGGKGKVVEADETFLGPAGYVFKNKVGWVKTTGTKDKMKVLNLVERDGRARSMVVDDLTSAELRRFIVTNVSRKTTLNTDEAQH